jgi:hypothetical protein
MDLVICDIGADGLLKPTPATTSGGTTGSAASGPRFGQGELCVQLFGLLFNVFDGGSADLAIAQAPFASHRRFVRADERSSGFVGRCLTSAVTWRIFACRYRGNIRCEIG